MEKVKVGFIGTGSIAYKHLKELNDTGKAEIVAVFDPKPESVKKFIEQASSHNISTYSSDEELIKKSGVKGVVICSPHTMHLSQIKLAMENGINVLVEKPAVVTYDESVKLRDIVANTKKVLVTGYQRHYIPLIWGARKIIEEGGIGDLFLISGFLAQDWLGGVTRSGRIWRFEPELAGRGQLTDSGSHFMAEIFFLTGLMPSDTVSFIDFQDKKVDVNSVFIIRFKENVIGSFGILGMDPSFRESLMLWGKKGVIKLSLSENSYVQYNGEKETKEIPTVEPAAKSPADDFIRCILEGKKTVTSLSIIEKVANVSDKIYDSFRSGTIVKA
jgi:predicted dehydrogenase